MVHGLINPIEARKDSCSRHSVGDPSCSKLSYVANHLGFEKGSNGDFQFIGPG